MGLEGWESDQLLDDRAVAELLHVSRNTVKAWRHSGGGPPSFRMGSRMVRYRKSEVVAWLEAQLDAGS